MIDQSRGILEYLDYCVDKYFHQILEKYKFKLVEKRVSGPSALYLFVNEGLKLQFINEKGVLETQIASVYSHSDFWDLDLLNVLIQHKDLMNLRSIKSIKRLSLSDEAELLNLNMGVVQTLFSKEHYHQTEKSLIEIGNRRSEIMFGSKSK